MNPSRFLRCLPIAAICLLGLAACKRNDHPVKPPMPQTAAAAQVAAPPDGAQPAAGAGTAAPAEPAVKLMLKTQAPPVVMKGEQFPLNFTVNAKPDEKSFTPPAAEGLEITTGLGEFLVSSNDMGPSAELLTYARITRTGMVDLPPASIKLGGKTYSSSPVRVEVVDKITVAPNDIRLTLKADKTRIKVGDEVNLAVTLYSRYSVRTVSKRSPIVSVKGGEGAAAIASDVEVDEAAGLPGLAKQIEQHFEVVDFDYEPMPDKSTVAVGGKRYYERNMLSLKLKAKRKGKVAIGPSHLDLMVIVAQSGYFAALNGDPGAMARFPKASVSSAPVTINIE